jgi:hypothetical protein
MLAATLLLAVATLVSPGEPLARSPIPARELEKMAPDVAAYFAALDAEATDEAALTRKQKALESIQKALTSAAKKAKVDPPLKYLADWDIVLEAAKPEDKVLRGQYGKGFVRHDFVDPINQRSMACLISIPATYPKAESPLPVIVALKPELGLKGAALDAKVAEMAAAAYGALTETHIVLVPLGPVVKGGKSGESTESEGNWFTQGGQVTFFTALRVLLEQVKFDRARLVIDGWGDAGLDAVRMASSFPSWFAGAINRSGDVGGPETLYENLTGIPVLYVDGKTEARGADLDALKARTDLRSEITVVAEPGSALAPSPETLQAITDWAGKCVRDLAPAAIHYKFGSLNYQAVHWLKAGDTLVRAGASPSDKDFPRIEARIDKAANKISVETVNVPSLFVYLNDALVDLDKAVIIEVNSKVRFNGKVKRSLAYLIENRYTNNSADYGLYVADQVITQIELNIPGKSP